MKTKRIWSISVFFGCLLFVVAGAQAQVQGLAKPNRTDVLKNDTVFQLITVRKANDADQLIRFNRRTGVTTYLKNNQWRLIKENGRRVRNSLYQVLATADASGGWNLYRLDMLSGDSWSVSSLTWKPILGETLIKPNIKGK